MVVMDFKGYEAEINQIVERENLYSLVNFDSIKFDDENALGFLSKIRKTRAELNHDGQFDLITHDLIYSVSSDIQFALANAYLYFPHANNFINETRNYGDGTSIPTYFVKTADKRFFFYINSTFEKLYNFWDRIGDILAKSFDLSIREERIYFSTVIESLESKLLSSKSGQWLKVFREGPYREILNRLRKKIVHYRQKDTYFYTEWLKSVISGSNSYDQITKLQQEKDELLPLLKEELHLANIGFEMMVRFIAECGTYENE